VHRLDVIGIWVVALLLVGRARCLRATDPKRRAYLGLAALVANLGLWHVCAEGTMAGFKMTVLLPTSVAIAVWALRAVWQANRDLRGRSFRR
jgi:hypothetical protein